MKSQKGMTIVRLVVFIVAMMLLLGVTTYVVVQDNGIYEREVKPLLQNSTKDTSQVGEK